MSNESTAWEQSTARLANEQGAMSNEVAAWEQSAARLANEQREEGSTN